MLRGFRMCRSSVLRNNYFCVFFNCKNCTDELFFCPFFLFKHAKIETDTVSPTQYFVDIKRPWRILQKKHGLNIAGHICGQWGLILASVYFSVIGMCGKIGRMHALLKDKRPSFSLSVSAHLTAIVCIFRTRLSQFKHNYAYVSHTPSVTSSYGEEIGGKKEGRPGSFTNKINLYNL